MEGHPLDAVVKDEAGHHEELPKQHGVDPAPSVVFEADARLLEEVDAVLREHVALQIKGEVELPAGASGGEVAVFVGERQSELDDLEQVDIDLEGLVVVVRAVRFRNWLGHDPGKFRVHRHVVVLFDDLPDHRHFLLDVLGPHVPDLERLSLVLERVLGDRVRVGGREGRRRRRPVVLVIVVAVAAASAAVVEPGEGRGRPGP